MICVLCQVRRAFDVYLRAVLVAVVVYHRDTAELFVLDFRQTLHFEVARLVAIDKT